MRPLAEILAGCPRPSPSTEREVPWPSAWAFPGFMLRRMVILLTQPKEAIGKFGAVEYRTPFLFFLFFTVITTVLHALATLLWILFLGPVQGGLDSGGFMGIPPDLLSNLFLGICETTFLALVFFGISTIILAVGVWLMTGDRSINPAFTITAYCYPLPSLISLIIAFSDIPWGFHIPPEINLFAGVLMIFWTLLMVVIAGYGMAAVVKTPLPLAIITAVCWLLLGMMASYLVQNVIVFPAEYGVSQAIFTTSYPAGTAR